MTNIILSPHFDDAVLSLGGLLTREGANSIVATFFAAAPITAQQKQWDKDCGFIDSDQAICERTKENHQALACVSVPRTQIRNYRYLDAQYRGACTPQDEQNLEAAIAKDIAKLIDENRGAPPIKIFSPGLGWHGDHVLVKRAFIESLKQISQTSVDGFLYQDIPYACWLLENMPSSDFRSLEQIVNRGEFPIEREALPFSQGEMAKKVEAIELYRSQLAPMGGKELCEKIIKFGAKQAEALQLSDPFCEVVYRLI